MHVDDDFTLNVFPEQIIFRTSIWWTDTKVSFERFEVKVERGLFKA